ncbi:MAG: hypothetical protein CALGDGBN_01210 [Pseudomonadales bacterium]|nr:hypothetical protein [Pseudomonadales bacterium]
MNESGPMIMNLGAAAPVTAFAPATASAPGAAAAALPAEATGAPATGMKGILDLCGPQAISGWLHDRDDPQARLEFEVLADGVQVAHGVADRFRKDLLDAGIGDGRHSFSIPVPEALFDGRSRRIEVRELHSGYQLVGSPVNFDGVRAARGEIVLDGTALSGHVGLDDTSADVSKVEVFENGKSLAIGTGWYDGAEAGRVRFHVPLPASVFDGRPHGFLVRVAGEPIALGTAALVMPYHLTPEEALLRHAREGMKPALAMAAGFRYEALARSLQALPARVADPAELAARIAQLERAHARLVRGFADNDRDFDPLVFPAEAAPRVSIVIPVHNKFPVTYHCLLSLLVAPNEASFELILVDDGSSDDSTRIPELVQGVQYLRNDEAVGFVRACNRGAAAARGDYIVMLNNDTEVTPGWIDELLWTFEHFEGVGMAGAKLLYPDGTLQEAGGIVWSSGNPWNYGRRANPHDPRFCYARQADYLSGACVMLPTALWNEIGGFSETYVPAYFEDTDLAFQVRDRGYRTVYAPSAQIIHFEGVSSGTSVSSGMKRFQEINRPKFKSRWIGACRNNGKEGVDVELHKDRNVEFRALVIDAETPMPDQNAGSYAAIQEMRMLQALGFKCTFAAYNMAYMGRYTDDLQRMGIETVYAPFAASVNELIERRGREFDLVYITRYYVARECIEQIRRHAPGARIVLMNADLHFLRELRAALNSRNPEDIARSIETRDAELETMRKVDLVLSYTDVEKAVILSHNLDSTRVAKCPWVCDAVETVEPFAARRDVAFLGGYNHVPNLEAVEWFLREVMPALREAVPGVRLRLYGSKAPKELRELCAAHEDVLLEGWVADVAEVYSTCRVFIAPLQSGAGIKGKVIGALAHGVPCVLSPVAAEGIALGDGAEAVIARTPADWVEAIRRLHDDAAAWDAMSQRAHRFAGQHYGMQRGIADMQSALQEAEIFTTTDNRTLACR